MSDTTIDSIQRNLAILREALPEGAKAMPPGMPPVGGAAPAPGGAPAPAASPSPMPALPGSPPPGLGISPPPPAPHAEPDADNAGGEGDEDEDDEGGEGDEEGEEGAKAFYEGCKGARCGRCLPCIEREAQSSAVAEGGKAAQDGAVAVAQVGSSALARIIERAVQVAVGPRLRRIERQLGAVAQGVDGSLTLGLKSAERLGALARSPAAAPRGPGIAVANPRVTNPAPSVHLPPPVEEAGKCPYDESQLLLAVQKGVLTGAEAQLWANRGQAPARLNNPVEAVKSVL